MIVFVGPATRRTELGLAWAAALVGCDVATLQADIQVEAASSGYDHEGRPKALFEPHIFYRHLSGAARDAAVLRGLAYRRWGTHPYPADSYPRLVQAMRIDPEAALLATSWGLPQILGENHGAAGYPSALAMVEAFIIAGEDEQLAAMARFLLANPRMRQALCERQWSTFAHLYNGPSTRGYDVKLAAAYARAVSIRPAEINAHIAARAATGARNAKLAGAAISAATLVAAAPALQVASHGRVGLLVGLVAAAVAIGLVLTSRASAFGNKAAAFGAASDLPAAPPAIVSAPVPAPQATTIV